MLGSASSGGRSSPDGGSAVRFRVGRFARLSPTLPTSPDLEIIPGAHPVGLSQRRASVITSWNLRVSSGWMISLG